VPLRLAAESPSQPTKRRTSPIPRGHSPACDQFLAEAEIEPLHVITSEGVSVWWPHLLEKCAVATVNVLAPLAHGRALLSRRPLPTSMNYNAKNTVVHYIHQFDKQMLELAGLHVLA
jgi:hypothetical protein